MGLVHAFGQKFEILHLYICGKIAQEYAFHDILERKNAFSAYKKKENKDETLEFFRRG